MHLDDALHDTSSQWFNRDEFITSSLHLDDAIHGTSSQWFSHNG